MNFQADDSGQLYQPDNTACGRLAQRDIKLLRLFKNEGLDFDLLWIPAPIGAADRSGTLWLTIYGAKALAKDVGNTLQEVDVYLQDPIHAERNTIYWNPQRFQNTEGLYTFSFRYNMDKNYSVVEQARAVNTLKGFTSEDDLPETEAPDAICTPLKRYHP